MESPGPNIRVLREQLGLSLKVLAAKTGIDQGNLSKLERGEVGYSQEGLAKIAKALHVSVGILFADRGAVEAAALRKRPIERIELDQLPMWKGANSIPIPEDVKDLHADLDWVSRHSFFIKLPDDRFAPTFGKGEDLIFDANATPQRGSTVIAHDAEGHVYLGRFRPLSESKPNVPAFEILPFNTWDKSVSTDTHRNLTLKAVLRESRKYHPE